MDQVIVCDLKVIRQGRRFGKLIVIVIMNQLVSLGLMFVAESIRPP